MSDANQENLTYKPGVNAHTPFTPFQQYDMSKFGMWLFIVTEIMFFGVLFVTFSIFRYKLPETWIESHKFLNVKLGILNTVVLLFSSFTVAWAVDAIKHGKTKLVKNLIWVTLFCSLIFMGVKTVEYISKSHEILLSKSAIPEHVITILEKENKCFKSACKIQPVDLNNLGNTGQNKVPVFANTFFVQYFIMTGIHGLHILIGIGLFAWILKLLYQNKLSERWYTPLEIVALYWHIVDVIWIYLFPLLYLTS